MRKRETDNKEIMKLETERKLNASTNILSLTVSCFFFNYVAKFCLNSAGAKN